MSSASQSSGSSADSLTDLGVARPGNDSSWTLWSTRFSKHRGSITHANAKRPRLRQNAVGEDGLVEGVRNRAARVGNEHPYLFMTVVDDVRTHVVVGRGRVHLNRCEVVALARELDRVLPPPRFTPLPSWISPTPSRPERPRRPWPLSLAARAAPRLPSTPRWRRPQGSG